MPKRNTISGRTAPSLKWTVGLTHETYYHRRSIQPSIDSLIILAHSAQVFISLQFLKELRNS